MSILSPLLRLQQDLVLKIAGGMFRSPTSGSGVAHYWMTQVVVRLTSGDFQLQ